MYVYVCQLHINYYPIAIYITVLISLYLILCIMEISLLQSFSYQCINTACPPFTFKNTLGNSNVCQPCPLFSNTTENDTTSTVCPCDPGYYRSKSDEITLPCTSEYYRMIIDIVHMCIVCAYRYA